LLIISPKISKFEGRGHAYGGTVELGPLRRNARSGAAGLVLPVLVFVFSVVCVSMFTSLSEEWRRALFLYLSSRHFLEHPAENGLVSEFHSIRLE
jgi:hypothetical protein